MKKKRFYKNKERNQRWTEPEVGREIDFAEKYNEPEGTGIYSDKFDYLRPKTKKKKQHRAKLKKLGKALAAVLIAFLVMGVGYMGMDVYMQRNAMPSASSADDDNGGTMNEVALNLKSKYVESISLDGGVMLESVISDAAENGYNSITFDLKRSEGSVGYKSRLAAVDTYGAVAFPAGNLKLSVETLKSNDILAVGRVYCYLDNLVPAQDSSAAVLDSNSIPYTDGRDNTYLNPDSQTAYKYIKDIILEAYEMGVTVFVLDGTDLPEAISDNYNDGFDYLAARLYADLGTEIKLLRAVNVSVTRRVVYDEDGDVIDEGSVSADIENKLSEDIGSNAVYFIKTNAELSAAKEGLDAAAVSSYILSE